MDNGRGEKSERALNDETWGSKKQTKTRGFRNPRDARGSEAKRLLKRERRKKMTNVKGKRRETGRKHSLLPLKTQTREANTDDYKTATATRRE